MIHYAKAGPDGSLGSVEARNSNVLGSNPGGSDIWHRGCAYRLQCPKLFKGLECTVLSMVLCTIKNHWSHSTRVGHSSISDFLVSRYCHNCAESDVKQYSSLCAKPKRYCFLAFQSSISVTTHVYESQIRKCKNHAVYDPPPLIGHAWYKLDYVSPIKNCYLELVPIIIPKKTFFCKIQWNWAAECK